MNQRCAAAIACLLLLGGCSRSARDAAALDRARRFAAADHQCPLERVRLISEGGLVHSFGDGRLVTYYGLVGVAERTSATASWWLDVCGERRRYVASAWAYDVADRTPPDGGAKNAWVDVSSIACVGARPRLGLKTADDLP